MRKTLEEEDPTSVEKSGWWADLIRRLISHITSPMVIYCMSHVCVCVCHHHLKTDKSLVQLVTLHILSPPKKQCVLIKQNLTSFFFGGGGGGIEDEDEEGGGGGEK